MENIESSRPLTFAISYGFVEGSFHALKLDRLLKKAGFVPAKNMHDADIIIAHSAGCWLIPNNAKPKLVIYVGMPLPLTSAQKTWLKSNWLSMRLFISKGHVFQMLRIGLLNTYYALLQPRRSLDIIHGSKSAQPVIFPDSSTVFIANRHDPWPRSKQLDNYVESNGWSFLSLPGSHNNIWQHPIYYVDIIKKYARLLAKANG